MSEIDKDIIIAFGKIKDYISIFGLTSLPKEAKEKIYEILAIIGSG